MTPAQKPTHPNRNAARSSSRPEKTGSPRWLITTIAVVAAVIIIVGIIATVALGGRLF